MLFLAALFVAALAGLALQKVIRFIGDWGRTALALVGAGLALIAFLLLFAADGITNAAALALSPLLFAVLIVPSAIGVRLAGRPGQKS